LHASSYIARLFHCSAENRVVSMLGSTGSAGSLNDDVPFDGLPERTPPLGDRV
jgi:hypothetical protein